MTGNLPPLSLCFNLYLTPFTVFTLINLVTMAPVQVIVRERPKIYVPETDYQRDESWKDYVFIDGSR